MTGSAEGCWRMWAKHLKLMVRDATAPLADIYCASGNDRHHTDTYRRQARQYILNPRNKRFEWVCQNIGLHPEAVREMVRIKIRKLEKELPNEAIPSGKRKNTVGVSAKTPRKTLHDQRRATFSALTVDGKGPQQMSLF